MTQRLTFAVCIALIVSLAGCGFHLRGSTTISPEFHTLYIQGVNMQQGLGYELKQTLRQNGVRIIDAYQPSAAVLTILSHQFDKRVLSVGRDARVSEYALYGQLRYTLTDAKGQTRIAPESLDATRDYQFQQGQVLGSEQEEAQLRQAINQELVQRLLRRLAQIK